MDKKQVRTHYKEWANSLDEVQKKAIYQYSNSGYRSMNAAVRKCPQTLNCFESDSDRQRFQLVDAALASASELPEPIDVYRGMHFRQPSDLLSFLSKVRSAKSISLPGPISTTLSKSIAKGFAGSRAGGAKIMFIIRTKKGAYLGPLASSYTEQEFLMRHNTKFKVIEIREGKGAHYVELEAE